MKGINISFEEESKEDKNPVVDLIYESIGLMEDNIRLFLENERLRKRIAELEKAVSRKK